MKKELWFNNIAFDDYVVDSDGSVWSQMCDKCIQMYEIDFEKYLDTVGSGICGVKSCNNEADSYIDFINDEIEIE